MAKFNKLAPGSSRAFRLEMKGTKSNFEKTVGKGIWPGEKKKRSLWPSSKATQKFIIQFWKPNYENEWSEITNPDNYAGDGEGSSGYLYLYNLGKTRSSAKAKWVALAKTGRMVKYTKAKAKGIENTEAGQGHDGWRKLDTAKQKRALEQLYGSEENITAYSPVPGIVELPIVVRWSDGYSFLVAGNTRFTAMTAQFGEGWVWQIDIADEVAEDKEKNTGKKSTMIKPSTAQQEQITLLIVQQVLNKDTKDWDSFKDMYDDKSSGLKKIKPDLKTKNLVLNDWWQSFNVQFNEIKFNNTNLKNNHYEIFNHNGDGVALGSGGDTGHNFMDYISKLMTKGPQGVGSKVKWSDKDLAKFAKKDSWNPADMWLLDTTGGRYDTVKKNIEAATSIMEVNAIMQKAFHDRIIKGISLKKNKGKKGSLEYDEVNLYDDMKNQPLPKVYIKEIQFDPHFDWNGETGKKSKGTKVFSSYTTTIIFGEKGSSSLYNLACRSNQTELKDITYEFKKQGGAAQLGKIPKDRFLAQLKDYGIISKFPGSKDYGPDNVTGKMKPAAKVKAWEAMQKDWGKNTGKKHQAITNLLKNYTWSVGDQSKQGMPFVEWKKTQPQKDAANNNITNKTHMEQYKKAKSSATGFVQINKQASWKAFETNLEESIKTHGIIKRNSIMMQMVDFLYLFALLKAEMKTGNSDAKFNNFLTNLFYWSQKKGQKWKFGPFGKMG